jgi:DNA-binding LacI/PurR family transcriptional regulator
MTMAATMRDVAALAGVSIKTVSNVINDHSFITPETKKKVLDAIAALDYRPNRSAQALRSRRIQSLAAIIPDIQNPFFTAVVRGIEDFAFEAGYLLLLCDAEDRVERENRYVQGLGTGTVAGVILCTADERVLPRQVEALRRANVAVVLVDRTHEAIEIDSVLSENVEGSYTAVNHLLSTGHRRIGIIAGPDYFAPGRERLEGYCRALQDFGIPVEEELIWKTDFKQTSSQGAARHLLALPEPPSAIFICNGPSALGTLEVVRDKNIRVPEDLALVVYDDPEWSRIIDVSLTVVRQPGYEMGQVAARLLLQRLEVPDAPVQHVRLPTSFIHRKSCCQPEIAALPG